MKKNFNLDTLNKLISIIATIGIISILIFANLVIRTTTLNLQNLTEQFNTIPVSTTTFDFDDSNNINIIDSNINGDSDSDNSLEYDAEVIFIENITDILSNFMDIDTSIAQDEITDDNSNTSQELYSESISRDFNNYNVQALNSSFPETISLSTSQPYGKVHYYNNTNSDITITVIGEGTTTISAFSSGSVVWKKSLFKSNYDYSITSESGNLIGSLSVAKASDLTVFQ